MITAKEAREKQDSSKSIIVNNEMLKIKVLIEFACSNGDYHVLIPSGIKKVNRVTLEKLGYSVRDTELTKAPEIRWGEI